MKSSNSALTLVIITVTAANIAAFASTKFHGSDAATAVSSVLEPGRGRHRSQHAEPWKKWAKHPLTVRLSIQPTNIYAMTNTTLEITLAGVHSAVNGRSCTDVTNGMLMGVDLNPRRAYLLTVVATNLQSMELDLQVQP